MQKNKKKSGRLVFKGSGLGMDLIHTISFFKSKRLMGVRFSDTRGALNRPDLRRYKNVTEIQTKNQILRHLLKKLV